jgi:hypothetical protein
MEQESSDCERAARVSVAVFHTEKVARRKRVYQAEEFIPKRTEIRNWVPSNRNASHHFLRLLACVKDLFTASKTRYESNS